MAPASSLRSRIAAAAAGLGLLAALGCGGGGSTDAATANGTGTISGEVSYTRIPLTRDAAGVPTGLDTNTAHFVDLPARGVTVRAFEHDTTSGADRWVARTSTSTDANGNYSLIVPAGENYVIQVESSNRPSLTLAPSVNVIADPNGLASTVSAAQRPMYLLRAAPDGTVATSSTPLPVSTVNIGATATVNFFADLNQQWLIGRTDLGSDLSSAGLTTAAFEATPTGSRPLAILDSAYTFQTDYGFPAASRPLDLHYLAGRSEAEGTYIEYDPQHWVQPGGVDLAYDGFFQVEHTFGSIRGATANDDAWDESVLFQLLSKTYLYNQFSNSIYGQAPFAPRPVGAPIEGLSPNAALVEGLPLIMAANLLKSPYLADTDGSSALLSMTDIRDLSGVASADQGPYSPRTLAAMFWAFDLKANGVTAPGTSTQWDAMNPLAIRRLFALLAPSTTTTNSDGTTTVTPNFTPMNIYSQLSLLKNAVSTGEPVDLAAIFNDATINTLSSPFNLPWPQPSTTTFGQAWTTSAVNGPYTYTGTLSMSADHQVNGTYANQSYQEVAYLGVSQLTDQAYQMTLQTTPGALPAGATIQVVVFTGASTQAYTFNGSSATPVTFTLRGAADGVTPVISPITVRLLSPSTLQPDIPFTLTLAQAPVGTLRGPVPVR